MALVDDILKAMAQEEIASRRQERGFEAELQQDVLRAGLKPPTHDRDLLFSLFKEAMGARQLALDGVDSSDPESLKAGRQAYRQAVGQFIGFFNALASDPTFPDGELAQRLGQMLSFDPFTPETQSKGGLREKLEARTGVKTGKPFGGIQTAAPGRGADLAPGTGRIEITSGKRKGFTAAGTADDILSALRGTAPSRSTTAGEQPTVKPKTGGTAAAKAPKAGSAQESRVFAGVPEAGAGAPVLDPLVAIMAQMFPNPSPTLALQPRDMSLFAGVPEAGADPSANIVDTLLSILSQEPL